MKDIVSKNNVNRQSDKIAEKAAAGLHHSPSPCYIWLLKGEGTNADKMCS